MVYIRMTMSKEILVIGGGGNVGYGVVRGLKNRGEGVTIGERRETAGEGGTFVDILERESIRAALDKIGPDLIVHLAAATDVNRCEREPEWASELNVVGTENVLLEAQGIPVVYFSTDFVFSGRSGHLVTEGEQPDPVSVYGKTKYEGERVVLDMPGGLVVRISFPWYRRVDHRENPALKDTLWWFGNTLAKGEDVFAYTNVVGTWTAMEELERKFADVVEEMINRGIRIIHLAGSISESPHAVAQAVRRRLEAEGGVDLGNVNAAELVPVVGQVAQRPRAGGLDTALARGLGWSQENAVKMIEKGEW